MGFKMTMFMQTVCLFMFMFMFVGNSLADANSNCPRIISRDEWGARSPLEVNYLIKPIKYVIIQHTVTPDCTSQQACKTRVFNTQAYHMETLEYNDIGYNFLIDSDGNVYEGVGWSKVGAHTRGYNSKSIGIAYIGSFDDKLPTQAAIDAGKNLIECGISSGMLSENVKLLAARQVSGTKSPGLKFYRELKHWRHWASTL